MSPDVSLVGTLVRPIPQWILSIWNLDARVILSWPNKQSTLIIGPDSLLLGKRWNCVLVDFLWNLKLSISFADFQLNGHVNKCLWPSCDPNGRSISHTQLHGGQVTVVQLRTQRCLSQMHSKCVLLDVLFPLSYLCLGGDRWHTYPLVALGISL